MNPGIAAAQQRPISAKPKMKAMEAQPKYVEEEEDNQKDYTEDYEEQVEEVEEDNYKDDEYDEAQESNVREDPPLDIKNKDEEVKGEQKAIISESDVDPLFEKLKFLLQKNNIKYNNMGSLFPPEITIMSLEHKLKHYGLKDSEERLTLARYIIEPRSNKKIEFNENRNISKSNAENVLKSKIEPYKTFENDEDQYKSRVREQVGRFTSTLKDSLECEDLDGTGYIPASTLKS